MQRLVKLLVISNDNLKQLYQYTIKEKEKTTFSKKEML